MKTQKKGFTLVELVIAIVIIGILSIVSVPMYQLHVEKARVAEAIANLRAIADAKITPEQIGYVNAHGTSTPKGDIFEFNSVKSVFANCLNSLSMSSTKSATGHALGAAGALEAIFSILALKDGILPPTLNLTEIDPECQGIDLVPLKAKEKQLEYVLSNSFGFGGTNASLIFKKI